MNTSTLNLTIQLPKFEGPLGLLLYLIRKEEMNIFDIEINKITAQYLEYIKLMKEFDLEIAGEFIAMASTLIQIKSRMLLPTYNDQGEVVETEDPRKELVQRLLEYQKFQEAAHSLYARPLLGRDVWPRGMREKFDEGIEEIELEENALYSLISSYRKALKAAQKRYHRVTAKTQSIAARILEIKDRLLLGQRIGMSELITSVENKRKEVLITFLSALELAKLGFVRLFQSDAYQEIYMETIQIIENDSISKVEEYEHLTEQEPIPEVIQQMMLANEEEFVLKDEVEKTESLEEPLYAPDEMASDDEIAIVEAELKGLESDEPSLDASVETVIDETVAMTEVTNREDAVAISEVTSFEGNIATSEMVSLEGNVEISGMPNLEGNIAATINEIKFQMAELSFVEDSENPDHSTASEPAAELSETLKASVDAENLVGEEIATPPAQAEMESETSQEASVSWSASTAEDQPLVDAVTVAQQVKVQNGEGEINGEA